MVLSLPLPSHSLTLRLVSLSLSNSVSNNSPREQCIGYSAWEWLGAVKPEEDFIKGAE